MKQCEYPHFYIHGNFYREDFSIEQQQFKSRTYPKGSFLPVQNEDSENCCYYIRSGILELNFTDSGSNTKIAAFFGPHSIAPLLFDSCSTLIDSECNLKAFTDLEVVPILASEIRQYCLVSNPFAVHLLEESSCLIRSLLFQQMDLSYASSFTRICDILLLLFWDFNPEDQIIPVSQADLADIAGCSRAQVERTVQQLRKEEIIQSGRKQILIRDRQKLETYCSDYLKSKTGYW